MNALAQGLQHRTRSLLEEALSQLKKSVSQIASADIHISEGGPDQGNAHWYKFEVIQSARQAGTYVNFDEAHYFIKASIRVERERLIFVTSFHHVGRGSDDREYVSQDFFLCSLEPFVLTCKTNAEEIESSFDHWLDAAVAVALKEYGDRL